MRSFVLIVALGMFGGADTAQAQCANGACKVPSSVRLFAHRGPVIRRAAAPPRAVVRWGRHVRHARPRLIHRFRIRRR